MNQHEKATEFFTSSLDVDPFFSHSILARGNVLMDSCNKSENNKEQLSAHEKNIARLVSPFEHSTSCILNLLNELSF